jgi:hypothetical protein
MGNPFLKLCHNCRYTVRRLAHLRAVHQQRGVLVLPALHYRQLP